MKTQTKAIITAVVLALAVLVWLFYGAWVRGATAAWWSLEGKLWVGVLAAATLTGIFFAQWDNTPVRNWDDTKEEAEARRVKVARRKRRFIGATITTGVLAVAAMATGPLLGNLTGAQRYTAVQEEGPAGEYVARDAYAVAVRAITQRAGDASGRIDTDLVSYLPGKNTWSVPVAGRGFNAGYTKVIEVNLGTGEVTTCDFTTPIPRVGGLGGTNLNNAIAKAGATLRFDAGDLFAYCGDGEGVLVVPVMRPQSWPQATLVPAGVVVLTGDSVTRQETVATGEYPGAVYPAAVAAYQRAATRTTGSWSDYLWSRVGYKRTTQPVDPAGDNPDAVNDTEFLLTNGEGMWNWVTPLTPQGTSSSIVAVASVAADTVNNGELNPLVITTLPTPREGNVAVADRVKAEFPDLGWAAGLAVVEIIPTSGGDWQATLANNGVASGAVKINEAGDMCLLGGNGEVRRCTNTSNEVQPTPEGTLPGPGENISGLSDDELARLIKEAAEELARRAAQ